MKNIVHVHDKLLPQRLIQIEPGFQRSHNLCTDRLFTAERSARDGIHQEECDHTDQEYTEQSQQNTFNQIFCHNILFPITYLPCIMQITCSIIKAGVIIYNASAVIICKMLKFSPNNFHKFFITQTRCRGYGHSLNDIRRYKGNTYRSGN